MRRIAAILGAAMMLAQSVAATPPNLITGARFSQPTTRYDHGILGDAIEWGALVLTVDMCHGCEGRDVRKFTIRLPETRVFEDIAPRMIPGGEDNIVVMVVETDLKLGARLALYDESGLVTATPFIGHTHRWLAPVGAADLDGDGVLELAYVEKPHLSKELKIWRYQDYDISYVTSLKGLANHRIGDDFITGGIRDCGQGAEIITADGNWRNIMATRFKNDRLKTRVLAPFAGQASVKKALECKF